LHLACFWSQLLCRSPVLFCTVGISRSGDTTVSQLGMFLNPSLRANTFCCCLCNPYSLSLMSEWSYQAPLDGRTFCSLQHPLMFCPSLWADCIEVCFQYYLLILCLLLNAANIFLTCRNAVTIEPRSRECSMNGTSSEITNFADACRGHRMITVTFLEVGRVQA